MKSILVVDDSSSMRTTARLALTQSEGAYTYAVSEAEDGIDALQRVKQQLSDGEVFDLAILDLNMPNMDGLELAAALRKIPEYAEVPLVFLTAENDQQYIQQAHAFDALAWIVKPFDMRELVQLVDGVFV